MNLISLVFIIVCLLAVSTEAVRRFLIFKARRDERRRKRKETIIDRERVSSK